MSIKSFLVFFFLPLLSSAMAVPQKLIPPEPSSKQREYTIPHLQYPKKPSPREFSVIEGMVYCQSCSSAGSWSLAGAKPLPSAKVGIACRDQKNRVWFYQAFQTDKNGYYYAPIVGLEEKKREISGCRVHLVSSADGYCNVLTNVNMGISGAGVGKGKTTKKGEVFEVVIYAAPPLAFRPAKCPYNYVAH